VLLSIRASTDITQREIIIEGKSDTDKYFSIYSSVIFRRSSRNGWINKKCTLAIPWRSKETGQGKNEYAGSLNG